MKDNKYTLKFICRKQNGYAMTKHKNDKNKSQLTKQNIKKLKTEQETPTNTGFDLMSS